LSGNGQPSPLPRGVDRALFAVAFAGRLRRGGVAVGLTAVEDFTRALAVSPPTSLPGLYWAARLSLVRRFEDLAVFDAVFGNLFADLGPLTHKRPLGTPAMPGEAFSAVPGENAGPEDGGGLPWATLPPVVGEAGESDSPLTVPQRLPSELEGLADQPFDALDARELELLGEWLRRAAVAWPTRRSRRYTMDKGGHRTALRQTIARSRRTGWEPIRIVHAKPVRKPRRVVLLCDVSQSMRAQASAYFHLMRALALVADAELFAFATRLTRLTTVLRHKSTAVAIDQATETVEDRFGGTRIAANLRALLASHHADTVRGAIVIIGSDGWDTDPPADLAAVMARLRRRASRIIWMNPRAGAPGFAPRVGAMAAALPFCDALLPADTFRSLAAVIASISADDSVLRRGR